MTIGGHHISPYLADTHPHVAAELDLIERALAAGLPYLGICFGAQALAIVAGGSTGPRPDGAAEFGFYPLEPTPSGSAMFDGLTHVFQSHYEACLDVPPGGELLARSEMFDVQAFRIGGSAIGLQFHPDTRADMIAGWWEGNAHLHHRLGTHPLERQLVDAEAFERGVHAGRSVLGAVRVGPRRQEDRAAAGEDPARALDAERHGLALDHPAPSVEEADELVPVGGLALPDHRADHRVEPRCVAAPGENRHLTGHGRPYTFAR